MGALTELSGLLRAPQRVIPLVIKIAQDQWRETFAVRHLYSYSSSAVSTDDALRAVIKWIFRAQRKDGGIAAYYSLLTGYSSSYAEVTGYIIPTLYDYGGTQPAASLRHAIYRATEWLRSLQMESGAFPGGLVNRVHDRQPSIFNTGQILQGLVRGHLETRNDEILRSAVAAGDWLVSRQQQDGSWSGEGAYQGSAHTYYSMVSWAMAMLASESGNPTYAAAANRNVDWVLGQAKQSGWIDGINLREHPSYLHFIAYIIQGMLECGILLRRDDAVEAARNAAWVLLRRFETYKRLRGTYEADFTAGRKFACLTGNAQMSCIWLRLFGTTRDLRYLNAALKMNDLLKGTLPARGARGTVGGVAGSHPIWGSYQPLRFISWGCKFLADALISEQRMLKVAEAEDLRDVAAAFPTKREASECA